MRKAVFKYLVVRRCGAGGTDLAASSVSLEDCDLLALLLWRPLQLDMKVETGHQLFQTDTIIARLAAPRTETRRIESTASRRVGAV